MNAKKIICILLVAAFAFSLAACGKYDKQTKTFASAKEITAFLGGKSIEEGDIANYKYTIKATEKNITASGETVTDIKADGKCDGTNEQFGAKHTYSRKAVYNGGKVNSKIKTTENGYRKHQDDGDILYVSSKTRYSGGLSSGSSNAKVRGEDASELYGDISSYLKKALGFLNTNIIKSALSSSAYLFVDGDDCTIVSSTATSYEKMVVLFNGNKISEINYISKTSGARKVATVEITVSFGKGGTVKLPDAEKYRDIDGE